MGEASVLVEERLKTRSIGVEMGAVSVPMLGKPPASPERRASWRNDGDGSNVAALRCVASPLMSRFVASQRYFRQNPIPLGRLVPPVEMASSEDSQMSMSRESSCSVDSDACESGVLGTVARGSSPRPHEQQEQQHEHEGQRQCHPSRPIQTDTSRVCPSEEKPRARLEHAPVSASAIYRKSGSAASLRRRRLSKSARPQSQLDFCNPENFVESASGPMRRNWSFLDLSGTKLLQHQKRSRESEMNLFSLACIHDCDVLESPSRRQRMGNDADSPVSSLLQPSEART
ncbi:hypothetical protein FVE85_6269 [Porphyridium purpureum]|uniref:Uncharacterized protein n=1 Tax=Porphyridium purpureum TaxID=35688 RepID=A0A5J4Z6N7_PORPP|nr:hypothetical protein FVE85_6269 [Porphyridium purpureum]|eukprot:POR5169..scf295_1